jgi:hypothetical protein
MPSGKTSLNARTDGDDFLGGRELSVLAVDDILCISFVVLEGIMAENALLIRFRAKDSKEGVTRATVKKLAEALDVSETAAVHRALAELARRHVPRYLPDDGPITTEQHRIISDAVRKSHGAAKVVDSLFGQPPTTSSTANPSARKRVPSSRAR